MSGRGAGGGGVPPSTPFDSSLSSLPPKGNQAFKGHRVHSVPDPGGRGQGPRLPGHDQLPGRGAARDKGGRGLFTQGDPVWFHHPSVTLNDLSASCWTAPIRRPSPPMTILGAATAHPSLQETTAGPRGAVGLGSGRGHGLQVCGGYAGAITNSNYKPCYKCLQPGTPTSGPNARRRRRRTPATAALGTLCS